MLTGRAGRQTGSDCGYSAAIMVSRPDHPPPRAGHGLRARVQQLRDAASRQFITRNRRLAFGLSLAVVAIGVAAAHLSEWWFSPGMMTW